MPTTFINEHCGDNKNFVRRIRNFGFEEKRLIRLKDTIDEVILTIKEMTALNTHKHMIIVKGEIKKKIYFPAVIIIKNINTKYNQ